MQESDIKSLTPAECPHCKKPIVLEFITGAPRLNGVYTPDILNAAKQEALAKITEMGIPEEFTKPTVDWINSPDTIFGPDDVEEVLKNIQKPNEDEPEEEDEEKSS